MFDLNAIACSCSDGSGNPWLLLVLVAGMWLVAARLRLALKNGGKDAMNKFAKIGVVAVLVVVVGIVLAVKHSGASDSNETVVSDVGSNNESKQASAQTGGGEGLPRLVDLGSVTCIPCKMMAPILEELESDYAGQFDVEFIDVSRNPSAAKKHGIKLIPTQIFLDASGRELFRHQGFFSKEEILSKWKELGFEFSSTAPPEEFERLTPAKRDERSKETICYMCDETIDPNTVVTVKTDEGPVRLCGPHCYFIMYSCLTEDKTDFETRVSVTDSSSGEPIPAADAVFLVGADETTGRPWIKPFATRQAAVEERKALGGNILAFNTLQQQELAHRCGFCDRACYPQDAAKVIVAGGLHTWGCCSHCALGVAARTSKDIEVHEKDRLTGEPIVVETLNGQVASLSPRTAVAWFGQRKKADGTWASAGCFHQGFFTSAENLKKWVQANPYETGRLISISKALADKMKLSPEQIQKACKIGECSPK